MKCTNCGGEIRLEDLYCPYCGSPNMEAHMHARDMHHYRQEFQQTRRDVIERAGRQSRRAVRIAAVALLLLGIGVNIFLQANSYAFYRIFEEAEFRKHSAKYIQRMEEYLDEEDYIGFSAFCAANNLSSIDDFYDNWYPIYRVANSLRYSESYIMKLVNHGEYTGIDHVKKYTSETIQEFYDNMDPNNYSYDDSVQSPETQRHLDNMRKDMEAMLVAYLGMTPEEAQSMQSCSRGNRVLLIERGLEAYN